MDYLATALSLKRLELTSQALKFFGYGIVAFAIVKILANFFSLEIIQENTFLHFIFYCYFKFSC